MTSALVLLVAGLATPWLGRRLATIGVPPYLAVAAQFTGLVLVWSSVLAVFAELADPQGSLVQVCASVLLSLMEGGSGWTSVVGGVLYVLLPGRALWTLVRQWRASGRVVHELRRSGVRRGRLLVSPALPTVAVTAGFLRPILAVDRESWSALSPVQRAVIGDHERGHARARHMVILALVRALAAGLAPWPGAAVAVSEVRRYLEAAADDYAARKHGPRTVALALARVAVQEPVVHGAVLAADGWSVWRVQRLLHPRMMPLGMSAVAGVAVLLAALVGSQGTAHALAGAHLLPVAAMCPI